MRSDYAEELRSFLRKNPEVKRYLQQNRMRFFVKLAVLVCAVLGVSFAIARYGLPIPALIFGAVALPVLPFPILHPERQIGKGYVGEIVGVQGELRRDTDRVSGVPNLRDVPVRHYIRFRVRTEDGKERTVRVLGIYQSVYETGGRVLVVKGLSYPIPLSPKKHTVCPMCGARLLLSVDHCAGCGTARIEV